MSQPTTQRADLLDALRGFALFGVVFSNFAMLSFWLFTSPEEKAALPGARFDPWVDVFHGLLIDGKFYSIFSMLFGIGFGFFLEKGHDGLWRFYRRMLVLLVIGWLHMRYLWEGDILFLYASLGLFLPLFRKVSDRALIIIATVLLLSPIAIDAATVMTDGYSDPGARRRDLALAADAQLGVSEGSINDMVPNGGLHEFVLYMKGAWLWRMEHILGSNRIPKVLAMFLIGLWVSRRKLFLRQKESRVLLRRLCFLGLALGLPASFLMWWSNEHLERLPNAEGLIATVGYAFGVVPLALAYAAGFTLLWSKESWQRWLRKLAPMGRMALTNYLMQTIIGLTLFTGMGFGCGTRVSSITFEGIAIMLFFLELAWSMWWLKRFQFGPFEWLWRSLTYGKVMPMRK